MDVFAHMPAEPHFHEENDHSDLASYLAIGMLMLLILALCLHRACFAGRAPRSPAGSLEKKSRWHPRLKPLVNM